MSTETFFNYRGYRWFWANLALLAVLAIVYLLHDPIGGKNGGTWYGYSVGALATIGILSLIWYAIRKRAYFSSKTTLKGCLAFHVWVGIALSFIVPLHAGFSFGMNVHTLAYVVMMVVILSGLWGAINYVALAPDIESHRGGGTMRKLLEQLHISAQNIEAMCEKKSDAFLKLRNAFDFEFNASLLKMLTSKGYRKWSPEKAGDLLAALPDNEKTDGLGLMKLLEKKREVAVRIQDETRVLTKIRFWLYIHLPLSLALVIVLAIHIFSVFFYW